MESNFKGKTVIITGGGGVLCSSFAKQFARCGAKVAILDINLAQAQKVAEEIVKDGGIACGFECNVLDKESVIKAEGLITQEFGEYHILLNGAGGNNPKANTTNEYFSFDDVKDPEVTSFFDLSIDGFNFVFSLNFMGTLIPTQVFAQKLISVQGASIINVSSMSAPCPMTKVPAYSAAKAAIENFTKWLAVHFANTNLRVNAIAPGFFLTNQNRGLLMNDDGTLTPRSTKIISHTPMRRFGEVDDLTGAVLFLADETASAFITGTVLQIDGGFIAYSGV